MPRLLKDLSHLRRSKISILTLFAPIFLVGGIAVVGYRLAVQSVTHTDAVERTYTVIGEIERELINLLDVETSVRGFVITGNADFVQAYDRAAQDIPPGLKRIRFLTADNPAQQANVDELEKLAMAKTAHLQSVIEQRKTSGAGQAMESASSGEGKNTMDDIREVAARMENEERHLLLVRRDRSIESAYRVQLACISFLLADLVVFGAMLALVVRIGRLQNLAKVCAWTKRVEYKGRWLRFEDYLEQRFGVRTTHGISADAAEKMKAELETLNPTSKR